MTRVAAVVVHWQHPDDTRGCVESALADGGPDVLVVDNGSREPPDGRLRGLPVTILRTGENRGYAGGANVGIDAALARGADVVVVLNDDARVRPGATAAALRVLDVDRRVAVVGPKVLLREDPSRLWLAWGRVTYRQSLVALCGAGVADGPAFARERDVDWVAGCAMWMRGTALRTLGGFDETFFAYHEEVDWCARARERGWRVVYAPDAVVTHTGRGSGGGDAAVRIRKYFAARNSILYARKHASALERAKLACFLAGTLPLQLGRALLAGRGGEVLLKIRGVADGLAGRRPPFERLGLR